MKRRRASLPLCWTLAALAGVAHGADAKDLRLVGLKDLLGSAWNEFSARLDDLMRDPRDDEAFDALYGVARRCDVEFKVPQYLEQAVKASPDDARLRVVHALFLAEIRSRERALAEFRAAFEKDGDDWFARWRAARLLGASEDPKEVAEARQLYTKAVDLAASADVDHRNQLCQDWGELVMDRAEPDARAAAEDEARAIWDRLIAGERRFDRATYERLAGIYRRYAMWDDASRVLRRCLDEVVKDEDPPARARLLEAIGRMREGAGDFAAAIAAYHEAIGLIEEGNWLHKQLLERVLRDEEKLTADQRGAVAELERACAERPRDAAPLRDLARARLARGDVAGARESLAKAHALVPADVPILDDLLSLERRDGSPEARSRAAALVEELVALMPEDLDAYVALADARAALDDLDGARAALRRLADIPSHQPGKELVLARAYRRFGMRDSALDAFENALAADAADTAAATELCDLCLELWGKDRDGADGKAYLSRARDMRDTLLSTGRLDETGALRLAQIFRERGRAEEAVQLLGHAALTAFPKSFACRSAFAEALEQTGDHRRAIQQYVFALERAPSFSAKKSINDRIVTLASRYGRRSGDIIAEPTAEEDKAGAFGGADGGGVAPWVAYLQGAIARAPRDVDALLLLAQVEESARVDVQLDGRHVVTTPAAARTLYASVVDMDIKNLDAHAALARVLAAVDDWQNAVGEDAVLEELSPVGKWRYRLAIGDLYAFAGDKDRALKNWELVRAQGASDPNLAAQLAARLVRIGHGDDAIALARKAVAVNRNAFRPRVLLGNLLDQRADYAAAAAEFSQAARLADEDPALTPYLRPVLASVLSMRTSLARARWLDGDAVGARDAWAAAVEDATRLRAADPSAAEDALDEVVAQRERAAAAAGDAGAGERFAAALTAHPAALRWVDDRLRATGAHLAETLAGRTAYPAPAEATALTRLPSLRALGGRMVPSSLRGAVAAQGSAWLDGGDRLWRAPLAGGALASAPLPAGASAAVGRFADGLLLVPGAGALAAIDPASGAPRWTTPCAGRWAVGGDEVAVVRPTSAGPATVALIDARTGAERWRAEVAAQEVALGDGVVLARGPDALVALDAGSGAERWRFALAAESFWRGPIVVAGRAVLVDDLRDRLVAIDARKGALRYERDLGASALIDPIASGGDVLAYTLHGGAVRVQAIDAASGGLRWMSSFSRVVPAPPVPERHGVIMETWEGINGTAVSDLTGSAAFAGQASSTQFLDDFASPRDRGDNFGARLRAVATAPADGDYVFWISSDDGSELWLASKDDGSDRRKLASVPGWAAPNEWTKFPEQRSTPVHLAAGQRCFLEALHKEGGGGDHVEVGWTLPGGAEERPMPGARLTTPKIELPPTVEALQGIGASPLPWRGLMLHLDLGHGAIWVLDPASGATAGPLALPEAVARASLRDVVGWAIDGDAIVFALRDGRVETVAVEAKP